MKYNYEIRGTTVTAWCNYAGKRIQASATCADEDSFDANVGMKLAAKRLDVKIWTKRYKKAFKNHDAALVRLMIALAEVEDSADYLDTVEYKLTQAESEYDEYLAELS